MNEFIKILLSLSFSGTLVLLLILFLKQFYKNKSSRCWQYYILLVAALRFVIPFTPELTVTGYIFENASTKAVAYYHAIAGNVHVINDNVTIVSNGKDTGGKTDVNIKITENNENTEKNKDTKINKNTGTDNNTETDVSGDKSNVISSILDNAGLSRYFNKARYIFVFIWLAVALALLVNKITTYQNFIRYVTSGNDGVSDIATLELFSGVCETMEVKRIIELYKSPLVSSPVMTGFLHPCIIIPEGQISEKYLVYIFKHELYHYKRRDMLYKWFVQIIICLHWFNPFVYLLGKEINKACELSCDEAVISSLDEKSRRLYGDTLVLFAGKGNFYKNNVASITLTEGVKQLKERLGNIMDNKKSKKKRVIAAILTAMFTVVICTGFIVSGAYFQTSGKETVQAVQKDKTDRNNNMSGIYTGSQNDNGFIYMRQEFYSKPYLIEMGWNLRKKQKKYYSCKRNIQLNHNKEITVYFDDKIRKYADDKEVSFALLELLKYLDNSKDYPDITAPLVCSVVKILEKDIPAFAEQEYIDDNPGAFSALYQYLDKKTKNKYLERSYKEKNIKIFSIIADYIDEETKETIIKYLDQSIEDDRIDYFLQIITYASRTDIERCAEKCYKKGFRFFSEIADSLDGETVKKYLDKSIDDNRLEYFIEIIEYAVQEDIERCAERCYGEKIKFFLEVLDYLDYGTVKKYLDQSIEDKNIEFFSSIMEYVSKAEDINKCARKCYKNGFVAGFAEIAEYYLSDYELEEWKDRAKRDKKDKFYNIVYSILY